MRANPDRCDPSRPDEGLVVARKAPRPPSPLMLAVKKFVPRDRYGVIYTTHYQEGGMRCKLYGASISRIPRGLKAWLTKLGYKNISIISGVGSGFRRPCVTILASFGGQYCGPRSPVMRAKKGRAAQQLAEIPPKPKKPDPVVMVTVPLKPTAAMCRAALIPEAEARRYYARMIAEFLKEPTDE